jgi:hypothetical protein
VIKSNHREKLHLENKKNQDLRNGWSMYLEIKIITLSFSMSSEIHFTFCGVSRLCANIWFKAWWPWQRNPVKFRAQLSTLIVIKQLTWIQRQCLKSLTECIDIHLLEEINDDILSLWQILTKRELWYSEARISWRFKEKCISWSFER